MKVCFFLLFSKRTKSQDSIRWVFISQIITYLRYSVPLSSKHFYDWASALLTSFAEGGAFHRGRLHCWCKLLWSLAALSRDRDSSCCCFAKTCLTLWSLYYTMFPLKFYCSLWLRKWISNYVIYYHSHTFWKTVCNHAKEFSCLNCRLSGFKICSAIDYSGHYGLSWTSSLVSLNFKLPMCKNFKIVWLAFCFIFF